MARYLARLLLHFVPVFFLATFLIYGAVFAMPGDPIRALAGEKPLPVAVHQALTDRYNLNDPLHIQYLKYLGLMSTDPVGDPTAEDCAPAEGERPAGPARFRGDCGGFRGILQGDFGQSFQQRPVADIMKDTIPITFRLAIAAFIFELVLGLIAGVMAALRRGSFIDNLVLVATTAVISIPVFVLGFLAQIIFGVELPQRTGMQWLPVSFTGDFRGYIMPAIVLGSLSLAYVARLTRTSLAENLRADYVRTATAKGLPRRRVIGRHALRNSLIPVVTFLGIDLGGLMGGAIITEGIFNVPGIGRQVFLAVRSQEGAVVVGIVTFLVLIFMISNLVVDMMYAWLDPRIRYE